MEIMSTLLPVFLIIILGAISKKREWLSKSHVDGITALLNLLMPIMIFNAFFTTKIKFSSLYLILCVFILHIVAIGFGKMLSRYTSKKYAHISPYMLATVDGGNVCFPLYATIVGSQYIGNIILLDIACIFVIFLVIPIMVTKNEKANKNLFELLKKVILSPIVISVLAGLLLNSFGVYDFLNKNEMIDVYESCISMMTAPIVSLILFMLGYQFKVEKENLKPILFTVILRIFIMFVGIIILITIFPYLMQDRILFISILLYFMCPPVLIITLQLSPAYKSEDDKNFISAFISFYMVITLVVYTLIVIFLR